MATFWFTAVPLLSYTRLPSGDVQRCTEFPSGAGVQRAFEADDLVGAQTRFNAIAAELRALGRSWHAWADVAKDSRAPRGFPQARDLHFVLDINPERVARADVA